MAFGFLLHVAGSYLVTQDGSRLIISFDDPRGTGPSVLVARDGLTHTRAWRDGDTRTVHEQPSTASSRGWSDGRTSVVPTPEPGTRTRRIR